MRLAAHKAEVPMLRVMQISKAAIDQRAGVIQRGGGKMVRFHESPWIGLARGEVGRDRVHIVATVVWHFRSVDSLCVAAAWFGKLPRHATHSDDGNARAPCEHEGHLQKNFQLRLDGGFGAVGKALGTIATLEKKGFAARGLREVGAQGIHFTVINQRR